MGTYEITDEMFGRSVVEAADLATLVDPADVPYVEGDSVGPKFGSVAAMILHSSSLDSTQDEECGDAQYGNGWHALFRGERAILHTGNAGFVGAWRVPDGEDLDKVWEEIESGAVTEGDHEDCDCGDDCHLTSEDLA